MTRYLVALAVAGSAGASELDAELGEMRASESLMTASARLAAFQEDSEEKLPPFYTKHAGGYFRVSGLVVDQLNDVRNLSTSETISLETGYGVSLAGGYRDLQYPVAFEIEYAFRRINANDGQDGRINLHTIGANVLFDASDLVGPFGVYAGGGVGITIDEISIVSTGGSTFVGLDGGRFFYQGMAGVTLSVHDNAQLYTGVRWTDSGTYESDDFRFHSEALNYEFGARFFF